MPNSGAATSLASALSSPAHKKLEAETRPVKGILSRGLKGNAQNHQTTPRYWTKNGQPINFDYVEERVIASGKSEAELIASAKRYKKLCGMTMEDHLRQLLAPLEAR